MLKKKISFTDFIACAEWLAAEKYTSVDRLTIMGGSAGGLLMGAVINMRPELFGAVVAMVPFVDSLNTALDASLPLTVGEYEEFGNPNEKVYYDYMKSYAPYENVAAQAYPAILITAGLNDPRVSYWEPAKWAAKLRALKTDDHLLLLKTNLGSGHFGASGRYEHLKETAFHYAFILHVLCVEVS
jgi:oligopeptidase B